MLLGISPLKPLEIIGRYEIYNQNADIEEAILKTCTAGLTYAFTRKSNVRINYSIRVAGKNITDPGDLLIAQLQFRW